MFFTLEGPPEARSFQVQAYHRNACIRPGFSGSQYGPADPQALRLQGFSLVFSKLQSPESMTWERSETVGANRNDRVCFACIPAAPITGRDLLLR